ncbi:hypothetical protein D3C81_519980 [compost metagenome]
MNAIQIANELFESNKFQTHKQLEAKLDAIKAELKIRVDENDEMRKEFILQDVVCKYTREKVYDVDNAGLNDFLHQYGLLIHSAKLSTKDKEVLSKIEEFKEEKTSHLRIYAKVEKEEYDFSKYEIFQLVDEFNKANAQFKKLSRQIKEAKEKMMECEDLKKERKQTFKFGSFGLVYNKDSYDIQGIYNKFGVDFIIENTTPSMEKVNQFIEEGFITKKELNQFRKMRDIILKFIVISLSDEKMIFNIMNNKRIA